MVSTLLTLAVASLALVLAYALLRRTDTRVRGQNDWEQKKHEVDVEIFRVLLNANEELQLRRFLPPKQFIAFQRRRLHLTLRMLRLVDDNAAMAMQLGRLAKIKANSAIAAQVDQMIATAFQLRLNLLLARLCLCLKWIFPSWKLSLPAFDMRYKHFLDSMCASRSAISQA
jgi:hypothetical protein